MKIYQGTESAVGLSKDGLLPLYPRYHLQSKMKKLGGSKSGITDKDRGIILSALFIDPHIFGYIIDTWILRSLANCLTNELGMQIKSVSSIYRE
jgi:hypothetical protein